MLRRLFTVLSALSLLLCVATVVLSVRSRSEGESFCLHQHFDRVRPDLSSGLVRRSLETATGSGHLWMSVSWFTLFPAAPGEADQHNLGFHYHKWNAHSGRARPL